MSSWYIQGTYCHRCSNTGRVPSLEWKQKTDGKYWFEQVWACDCGCRHKIKCTPYSHKYSDGFQFFFTMDIMKATKPPITYHEVFYVYARDFWTRLRTDRNTRPYTDYSLLKKWLARRNAMDWSKIALEVDQTLLNLT